MTEHPAVTELKQMFVLHGDNTQSQIKNWIDRWISSHVIETTVTEENMMNIDQDILFDQMFTRLAKSSIAPKTNSSTSKLNNGDFHFIMKVHCLNRDPSRILKAVT